MVERLSGIEFQGSPWIEVLPNTWLNKHIEEKLT
jgi:hypothetical protein